MAVEKLLSVIEHKVGLKIYLGADHLPPIARNPITRVGKILLFDNSHHWPFRDSSISPNEQSLNNIRRTRDELDEEILAQRRDINSNLYGNRGKRPFLQRVWFQLAAAWS